MRPKLKDDGIDIEGVWTNDFSRNFFGGIRAGNADRNLLDLRANLDLKPLLHIDGALVSIDFQNQAGADGSADITGDFQRFDNLDADGRTQISELWYQQTLLNQKVRIKIGKVDANSEFSAPINANEFLNSSFGNSPTIVAMPTYPDPAMSANVFVYPSKALYAGAGVYDGSFATGVLTGAYGPKHFFSAPGYYFLIGEAGLRYSLANETLPGRLAIGGSGSTARFPRYNGGSASGTSDVYVLFDQTLWRANPSDASDNRGIGVFAQYGAADGAVNPVTDYVGAGAVWAGPWDLRPADQLGVGMAYARFTSAEGAGFTQPFEMAIEGFYLIQLTSYLQIKPDLQYLVNPGGDGKPDALVATIRMNLSF